MSRVLLLCAIAGNADGHKPSKANAGIDADISPHLAMGVRVGDVTPTSAVVWTRLTLADKPNREGFDLRAASWKAKVDTPGDVSQLWGACPGAPGKVRLRYARNQDFAEAICTEWTNVNRSSDYSHHFTIDNLTPATKHYYRVETSGVRGEDIHSRFAGSFTTAPPADSVRDVRFTVVTGQGHRDLAGEHGYKVYQSMSVLKPDFMTPTGDTVYIDADWPMATSGDIARFHWQRAGSLPGHVEFWRHTPGYWMKDDHDTYANDCWPSLRLRTTKAFTFEQGVRIARQNMPIFGNPYRTFRWGRDLQIWLMEAREYRMPNDMPDGPRKTLWGKEQKAWLKHTVQESNATWKIVLSPTPIVGPERAGKSDNHCSAFQHEGNEVRSWLASKSAGRVFVICGDIHFQYHSEDPATHLQEFSCGPVSDAHAGGSTGKKPEHLFHRVAGGFLSVAVKAKDDSSSIAFSLHDVNGRRVYKHARTEELR